MLSQAIADVLRDNPPILLSEGGLIRDGVHAELDELRSISSTGKQFIAALEAQERSRTGIQNLKVKFNNVFGYYIEVSKSNLGLVPADYERKQTLVGAERFTMPVLKEYERKVLGAEERVVEIEYELFCELRGRVGLEAKRIRRTASALSQLDCLTLPGRSGPCAGIMCGQSWPTKASALSGRDVTLSLNNLPTSCPQANSFRMISTWTTPMIRF